MRHIGRKHLTHFGIFDNIRMLLFDVPNKGNQFFISFFFLNGIQILCHLLNRFNDTLSKNQSENPAYDKNQHNNSNDFRQDIQ